MTGEQPRLFLFAVIQIKPEYFEEAKAALDQIIPPTLEEPGCHVFAAFTSKDKSNTLHLFECFDDEDALNFHYAQDYTASVFKKYESWLNAPVEITKMSATSPVSWEQFHE
ncbi:putative quinol monooxygenase [Leisingera sp.]|uniref:putative quinol monooxygenase n=1 Tax=Leisingera sp. TaxID=1879318 RepID=UPI003A8E50DE